MQAATEVKLEVLAEAARGEVVAAMAWEVEARAVA